MLTFNQSENRYEFRPGNDAAGKIAASQASFKASWEDSNGGKQLFFHTVDPMKAARLSKYAAPELRDKLLSAVFDPARPVLKHINGCYVLLNYETIHIEARRAGFAFTRTPYQDMPRSAGARFDSALWWTEDVDKAILLADYADEECQGAVADFLSRRHNALEASRAADAAIEIPCPDDLSYMAFQRGAVAYAATRKRVGFFDEMGLGKTIQAIAWINLLNETIRSKSDYVVKKVLVICPASLKRNWQLELTKWLYRPLSIGIADSSYGQVVPDTDIVIINYDILAKRVDTGKRKVSQKTNKITVAYEYHLRESLKIEWDMLIVDECFPYDTPILTTIGYLPIGEIVENHLDTYVASCNLSTGGLEWRRIQRWIRKPKPHHLVKITHESDVLYCTPNHKIWTEEDGYVRADSLTRSHHLRILRQPKSATYPFLLERLRRESPTKETPQAARSHRQVLWLVWGQVRVCSAWTKGQATAFLRSIVFGKVAHEQTGSEGKKRSAINGPQTPKQEHHERDSEEVEHSHDCDESRSRRDKHPMGQARAFISLAWWQRAINRASEVARRCFGQSTDGTRNSDRAREWRVPIAAPSLQSRHSGPFDKGRYRGRRQFTQHPEVAFSRQAQNGCFERSRVVSVEVQKQRGLSEYSSVCPDGPFVYNLEVDEHHNYLANDVLVSNCHLAKGEESQVIRARMVYSIKARRMAFLSGTPMVNRPRELWNVAHHLAPQLFPQKREFLERYCKSKNFFAPYDGGINLDELQQKLRSYFMVRRLKKDVLKDLPAKLRQVIELPATGCEHLVREETLAADRKDSALAELRLRVELSKASDDPGEYTRAVGALKASIEVAFEELSKLRHDTAVAKIPIAINHIASVLESVDKVIVGAHHHEVVEEIAAAFKGSVFMHSGTKLKDRQAAVESFQNDPNGKIPVIVGSIGTMGVGWTLTASSYVVLAELSWVPGDVVQFEDRAHRIGQKDCVTVQHLVLAGSLDARMAVTLVAKQDVADRALDRESAQLILGEPVTFEREKVATMGVTQKDIAKLAAQLSPLAIGATHDALKYLKSEKLFRDVDAPMGNLLAGKKTLTPKLAALAGKMLMVYRHQITGVKGVQILFDKETK